MAGQVHPVGIEVVYEGLPGVFAEEGAEGRAVHADVLCHFVYGDGAATVARYIDTYLHEPLADEVGFLVVSEGMSIFCQEADQGHYRGGSFCVCLVAHAPQEGRDALLLAGREGDGIGIGAQLPDNAVQVGQGMSQSVQQYIFEREGDVFDAVVTVGLSGIECPAMRDARRDKHEIACGKRFTEMTDFPLSASGNHIGQFPRFLCVQRDLLVGRQFDVVKVVGIHAANISQISMPISQYPKKL